MFGSTLDFEFDTVAHALRLISEANGVSTYRVRTGDYEITLNIRQSSETKPTLGVRMDRHNVDVTVRRYPTLDRPEGTIANAYIVIRNSPNGDGLDGVVVAQSLLDMLAVAGNLNEVVGVSV